jgi:hypothetical protein
VAPEEQAASQVPQPSTTTAVRTSLRIERVIGSGSWKIMLVVRAAW